MLKPTLLSKEKVGFRSDGSLTGLRAANENSAFVGEWGEEIIMNREALLVQKLLQFNYGSEVEVGGFTGQPLKAIQL
jgi:hypothetical protein